MNKKNTLCNIVSQGIFLTHYDSQTVVGFATALLLYPFPLASPVGGDLGGLQSTLHSHARLERCPSVTWAPSVTRGDPEKGANHRAELKVLTWAHEPVSVGELLVYRPLRVHRASFYHRVGSQRRVPYNPAMPLPTVRGMRNAFSCIKKGHYGRVGINI